MSITFLGPDDEPPAQRSRNTNIELRAVRLRLAENPGAWAIIAEAPFSDPDGYTEVNRWASGLRHTSPVGHPELVIQAAMRSNPQEGWRRMYARAVPKGMRNE